MALTSPLYNAREVASHDTLRESYRRDGLVVARGLFTRREVRELSALCAALVAGDPLNADGPWLYYEEHLRQASDDRVIHRVEHFRSSDHPGAQILFDGRLAQLASVLLGATVTAFKEKLNFKAPGASGFAAHQDMQAGWSAYASEFVTAAVSIDSARVPTGCLEFAKQHHQRGLLEPEWAPLSEAAIGKLTFEPCETAPGDVVFFSAFTPHRSAPNVTNDWRRLAFITFNRKFEGDHYARYHADKFAAYPPDAARTPGHAYRYRV